MTLPEVLLSGELAEALAGYGLLSLAAAWLAARLESRLDHDLKHWLWQHLYAPLLRAGLLCLFLLMAYPVLYGLREAPPASDLLLMEGARAGHLLGTVLLLSLALPLLPLRYAGPALALPLQGIAASTLLYSWLAEARGLPGASLWVGLPTLGLMALLALLTHLAAGRLLDGLQAAGTRLLGFADLDTALREILVLWIQVPVVLVYTLQLGGNLASAASAAA